MINEVRRMRDQRGSGEHVRQESRQRSRPEELEQFQPERHPVAGSEAEDRDLFERHGDIMTNRVSRRFRRAAVWLVRLLPQPQGYQ